MEERNAAHARLPSFQISLFVMYSPSYIIMSYSPSYIIIIIIIISCYTRNPIKKTFSITWSYNNDYAQVLNTSCKSC